MIANRTREVQPARKSAQESFVGSMTGTSTGGNLQSCTALSDAANGHTFRMIPKQFCRRACPFAFSAFSRMTLKSAKICVNCGSLKTPCLSADFADLRRLERNRTEAITLTGVVPTFLYHVYRDCLRRIGQFAPKRFGRYAFSGTARSRDRYIKGTDGRKCKLMTTPPILEEIRRVRHAMSAEINHDPARIVEYFAAMQKKHANRIVNLADQGPYGRTNPSVDATDQPLVDDGSNSATR